ncbi:MAG TPA: hypothetical protein VFZ09_32140 [Archangium sp.]|uniref:hypothetical protein n=1 Tax=Archangium sp. TaxID=1872627 RepID=UPI002E2F8249|nr:hypothetical protein [Archangium sp.]HEX5750920.1 hypothetical protein [Archangium sp.]
MTTVFFPDCEATSPNGRFTLEARSHRALEERVYQDDFVYRLFDGDRVVWERRQGPGEHGPHQVLVSDDGWSILRTHGYTPQVIAVSPEGHDTIHVLLRRARSAQEPAQGPGQARRCEWVIDPPYVFMGGLFWAGESWPYFFQVDGTAWFVWRTSWGPRLVLDLTQGLLVPEDSPARAAITRAMDEAEKRGAYHLLWKLAARLYEVQQFLASRERPSIGDKPSPLQVQLRHVRPALKLVGLHRCEEALPVLRFWERLDHAGSSQSSTAMGRGWDVEEQAFRPLLHHALRLLGEEPLGYAAYHFRPGRGHARFPVPEHVAHRRERAAELDPGMSAEQVLQRVGSPDHVRQHSHPAGKFYRWTEQWDYDFRVAGQWVTLRLTWEEHESRGRLSHIQEAPASWLQADER